MSSAFLSRPGSTLGQRVVELVDDECFLLEPAARVRIEDRAVLWNGTRLDSLSTLLVEAPLVPWPQPAAEPRAGEPVAELQRRGFAVRERRALHVSALRLLAGRVRVANDPERAAELAYSAALALERLELAKVPVRPWRIRPEASGEAGWIVTPLAAEHGAEQARIGPCFEVELGARPARAHLCIDGAWVAASEREASLETRLARSSAPGAASTKSEPPAAERELACAALAALGLDFAAVHVADGAVALVSVAPDLQAWDHACDGRVARALADLLTSPRTAPIPT